MERSGIQTGAAHRVNESTFGSVPAPLKNPHFHLHKKIHVTHCHFSDKRHIKTENPSKDAHCTSSN